MASRYFLDIKPVHSLTGIEVVMLDWKGEGGTHGTANNKARARPESCCGFPAHDTRETTVIGTSFLFVHRHGCLSFVKFVNRRVRDVNHTADTAPVSFL